MHTDISHYSDLNNDCPDHGPYDDNDCPKC